MYTGAVAVRLDSYEDWRHCITVDCGIPLTTEFCRQRLRIMSDPDDPTTVRFIQTWGEDHRRRVVEWFGRALAELGG